LDHLALLVLLAWLEDLDLLVYKEALDLRVMLERWGKWVQEGLEDQWDHRARTARGEDTAKMEEEAHLDKMVLKARGALMVSQVCLDKRVTGVVMVHLALLVLPETLETRETMESVDCLECPVSRVSEV